MTFDYVISGPCGPTLHTECARVEEALVAAREACPQEGCWESWRLSLLDGTQWRAETGDDPVRLLQLCRQRLGRSSLTITTADQLLLGED